MAAKRKASKTPDARRSLGRRRDDAVFPVAPPRTEAPRDYAGTLREIKRRIQQERLKVVLAANSAMVLLYWDIGRVISIVRTELVGAPRSSIGWPTIFARPSPT